MRGRETHSDLRSGAAGDAGRRAARGNRRRNVAAVVTAILVAWTAASRAADKPPVTRLVVEIVVDQLRGDLPLRHQKQWSDGGFRRLYDRGAVFSDAHHGHANTETIVGHATLATGADPSVHGMVGNAWLERSTGDLRYNVEDPRFEIVGNDEKPETEWSVAAKERAPKSANGHVHAKPRRGRSPEALLAPTIADAIAAAGGGKGKVFAVSLKDRGAVPMGGRAGKAFWLSDATGEFISSTYYYPDRKLPEWASGWNAERRADGYSGRTWTLLLAPKLYRSAGSDDMPWEAPPRGMKRTFPHRFDRTALGDGFYAALQASPFGDDLLVSFARALIREERLGRDDVTDYLSVSFSSPDYVGHRYGPDSLEMEDEVIRVDRAIAKLLEAADDAAGPGRTLFVLTADHGVVDPPEALARKEMPGGRVFLSAAERSAAAVKLSKKVGTSFVRRWPPYIYLDRDALLSHNIEPDAAERAIATEMAKLPGVAAAYTRGDIQGGRLPDTLMARAVTRSFHPDRSGDIHIVSKPGWQISFELPTSSQFATGHGTPWHYDTYVPLVFAGPNVPHVVVKRRVDATDVAPTIAALLGIAPPAKTTGQVLAEAIRKPVKLATYDDEDDD